MSYNIFFPPSWANFILGLGLDPAFPKTLQNSRHKRRNENKTVQKYHGCNIRNSFDILQATEFTITRNTRGLVDANAINLFLIISETQLMLE